MNADMEFRFRGGAKFCAAVAMAALVFAALGPGEWVPHTGLGFELEHFLALFVVTSIVCLAWPPPLVVGGPASFDTGSSAQSFRGYLQRGRSVGGGSACRGFHPNAEMAGAWASECTTLQMNERLLRATNGVSVGVGRYCTAQVN
jgi:hypothetical protein